MLKFQPINLNGRILVTFGKGGTCLGDLMKLEDGYYQFFSYVPSGGCWSAHLLREIADKLDELNDQWDQEVKRGLSASLADHVTRSLSEHLHGDADSDPFG